MSRQIYKYSIPEGREDPRVVETGPPYDGKFIFKQELPYDSQVRFISTQNGSPMMWVEVPAGNEAHRRKNFRFQVVGTGHPELPDFGATYLGTWKSEQDLFIFHVYQLEV